MVQIYTHHLNKSMKFLNYRTCVLWSLINTKNGTFVVEDALHLHGRPGVGDAEHGAGHQTLQGRGAVCGPDQAPVWPFMTALQDLHRLTTPHGQLVAVAGHEVMYHHSQLTATGELRERTIRIGIKLS